MPGNALDKIIDSLSTGRIGIHEFMQAIEREVQVLEQVDYIHGGETISQVSDSRYRADSAD